MKTKEVLYKGKSFEVVDITSVATLYVHGERVNDADVTTCLLKLFKENMYIMPRADDKYEFCINVVGSWRINERTD